MTSTLELTSQETARLRRETVRAALLVALTAIMATLISALLGKKLIFLFKEQLHLSASGVGTLLIIVGLPSYIQPFLGAWSDMFTLFGYHRRSFYVVGVLVDVVGYLCLALLPQYHYLTVVALLIVTGTGAILIWVMVRAVMVAVGNLTGTIGQLQSMLQFLPYILTLTCTARLSGYVTQHWSYHSVFLAAAGMALLRLPLAWIISEKRVNAARHAAETHAEHQARSEARRQERAAQAAKLRKALASPGIWAITGYVFYLIVTPGLNTAQIYYETDVLHFSKYFVAFLVGAKKWWAEWNVPAPFADAQAQPSW